MPTCAIRLMDRALPIYLLMRALFLFSVRPYSGRQAIKQKVLGAEVGPVTRHLISTVDIESNDPGKARGVSYVTVCIGPRSDSTNPMKVEGFAGIGEYHDRFVVDAGECLIESREFIPVFTYQDK